MWGVKMSDVMNADQAYLIGLIVGGGKFGNAEDVFTIKLPYKRWGSYLENPMRASDISRDIMKVVSPMFKDIYNLMVSFESTGENWSILCDGDTSELVSDLESFGVECEGELRGSIDLKPIIAALVDDNLKRRFIAGLADTIGSTAPSHRRFSNEVQIISFEITGFNYSFVCDLCKLLYSLKCFPDQILWNHPNFHATNDPYYTSWKKGFKLRVQLEQYANYGAFAFTTKVKSTNENLTLQESSHDAVPCAEKDIRVTPSCVHPAEHSACLPLHIRGGHYLHNRHVCAVMACEHAPYNEITDLLKKTGELVNPFPLLHKDIWVNVESKIKSSDIMKNRTYNIQQVAVKDLLTLHQDNDQTLSYNISKVAGYELTTILQGIAYILAEDSELKGRRIKGNYIALIERHIEKYESLIVEIRVPDLLTPLIICGNNKGVLVAPKNPTVYQSLMETQADNPYKISMRPITEQDLKNV